MPTKPNLQSDLAQLIGFKDAYTINGSLLNLAVPTMQALEDDLRSNAEFVNGIPATYQVLIKAGGADSAQLQKAYAGAFKAMQGYLNKREELVKTAQATGEKLLGEATQTAQRAAEGKQAALFGQVTKSLDKAKSLLDHLRTMDYGVAKEVVKTLTKLFTTTQAAIAKSKAGMEKELLSGTKAPVDVYTDKDKAVIAGVVLKAWKKQYPKDDVLGVRFPNPTWERDVIARWSSAEQAWHKTDTAVLRLNVVVKTKPTVATIYQAYVNNDVQSDKLTVGVDTKGSEYVVQEMLVENWK